MDAILITAFEDPSIKYANGDEPKEAIVEIQKKTRKNLSGPFR